MPHQQVFQEPLGQKEHSLPSPDMTQLAVPGEVLQGPRCIRAAQERDGLFEREQVQLGGLGGFL